MNLPTVLVSAKGERVMDIGKVLVFVPSVVAIVASISIGFLVVWPKFNEVLKLSQSNKILEETATKLEDKAAALLALDSAKLRTQLSAAEQLLPSDKSIFTFIRQVENVRNDSGVVIKNLSVGNVGQFKPETGDKTSVPATGADGAQVAPAAPIEGDVVSVAGVNEVGMKLSVTSDYRSILQFLNSLYSLPRVTIIKDLSFSTGEGGQLTTNLTVSSLWQPLPGELPSIEAPLVALDRAQVDLLTKVENTGAVSSPVVVPDVPKGKPDIFSTF